MFSFLYARVKAFHAPRPIWGREKKNKNARRAAALFENKKLLQSHFSPETPGLTSLFPVMESWRLGRTHKYCWAISGSPATVKPTLNYCYPGRNLIFSVIRLELINFSLFLFFASQWLHLRSNVLIWRIFLLVFFVLFLPLSVFSRFSFDLRTFARVQRLFNLPALVLLQVGCSPLSRCSNQTAALHLQCWTVTRQPQVSHFISRPEMSSPHLYPFISINVKKLEVIKPRIGLRYSLNDCCTLVILSA